MIKQQSHWNVGRCPNGKVTHSLNVYIRAWRSIIRKTERFTGLTCIGFDPGLLMRSNNKTISLPLWFVERILKNVD